ncbi:MAG TPA: hypothetical protein PLA93_00750 [Acinetobacter towneri]|uniref:hypothetical protein n=1 Tax=Acinetobacter sp. ANC 5045 TaxID=2529851 RepID=UPI001D195426|nr:hypothetical protein [Acinetobacter sp. ANC 5045]HRO77260.1 hypothetical protein [Acinetobacter towneri]
MSTISTLAFEIQQAIKSHNIEIKRSHINEIVAALFGFKKFNSLKLSSYPIYIDSIDDQLNAELFVERCGGIKYITYCSPSVSKIYFRLSFFIFNS